MIGQSPTGFTFIGQWWQLPLLAAGVFSVPDSRLLNIAVNARQLGKTNVNFVYVDAGNRHE